MEVGDVELICVMLLIPPLLLVLLLVTSSWEERRLCVVCKGTPIGEVTKEPPVHLCDAHWRQVFRIGA